MRAPSPIGRLRLTLDRRLLASAPETGRRSLPTSLHYKLSRAVKTTDQNWVHCGSTACATEPISLRFFFSHRLYRFVYPSPTTPISVLFALAHQLLNAPGSPPSSRAIPDNTLRGKISSKCVSECDTPEPTSATGASGETLVISKIAPVEPLVVASAIVIPKPALPLRTRTCRGSPSSTLS